MKKGLDEAKTVLWTSICWPSSQARVTSAKFLSIGAKGSYMNLICLKMNRIVVLLSCQKLNNFLFMD